MKTGAFTGFDLTIRENGIAWFQFNTPERLNGMTTAIKRDLIEAVTQAQMDNKVRVLVFTGTGRGFCAGDDLKAYKSAELAGTPLVDPIPPGHDNPIGTYDGLRTISQQLNTTIRNIDKLTCTCAVASAQIVHTMCMHDGCVRYDGMSQLVHNYTEHDCKGVEIQIS